MSDENLSIPILPILFYVGLLTALGGVAYFLASPFFVKKRGDRLQQKLIENFEIRSDSKFTDEIEEETELFDLSILWADSTKSEKVQPDPYLIVDMKKPKIARRYIVKLLAEIELGDTIRNELESDAASRLRSQLHQSLSKLLASQPLERMILPSEKKKLKEKIRDQINRTLGRDKILAIYFDEFYFQ